MTLSFSRIALASALLACTLGAQEKTKRAEPEDTVRLRYAWPSSGRLEFDYDGVLMNDYDGRRDSTVTTARWSLAIESRPDGIQLRLLHLTVDALGRVPTTLRYAAGDTSAPAAHISSDGKSVTTARLDDVVDYLFRILPLSSAGTDSSIANLRNDQLAMATAKSISEQAQRLWRDGVGFWHNGSWPVGIWYQFPDTAITEFAPGKSMIWNYAFRVVQRLACDDTRTETGCVLLEREWSADTALHRQMLSQPMQRSLGNGTVLASDDTESAQLLTRASSMLPAALQTTRVLRTTERELNGAVTERQHIRRFLLRVEYRPGDARLHVAARTGDVNGILAAVSAGETVDVADDSGRTPLIIAAMAGREAAARRLLAMGADGARALDFARTQGDVATARRLFALTGRAVPVNSLAHATSVFDSLDYARAVPLFVDAVIAEPDNLLAQRGLLEAKLYAMGGTTALISDAEALLARSPCDQLALLVHGAVATNSADPPPEALDSAVATSLRAVACDSTDTRGWLVLEEAARKSGRKADMQRAIMRLVSLLPITQEQTGTVAWLLDQVPTDAVLVLPSLEDYAAAVRLQRDGVRPDVRVHYREPPAPTPERPLVLPSWSSTWNGFAGEFRGAYLRQSTDGRWTQTSPQFYELLRDAAPRFSGPVFERDYWHRPSVMEQLESKFANVLYHYLLFIDPATFAGDARRLLDADSASFLLMQYAHFNVTARAEYVRMAAEVQARLATFWTERGYPWRALPYGRRVVLIQPAEPNSWLNFAYFSLASGALAEADSALRVVERGTPMLTTYLNRATLSRLQGDATHSLTSLRRARAFIDSLAASGADSVVTWTLPHHLSSPADTFAVRPTMTVSERTHREALIRFNEALALAMTGNRAEADRAVAAGLAADNRAEMRCYAAAMSVATRGFAKPAPAVAGWLEAFERRMLQRVECPGSGSGRNVGQ